MLQTLWSVEEYLAAKPEANQEAAVDIELEIEAQ
jgi:hypothetical protein